MIAAALAILENEGQREELSEFYEKYKSKLYAIAFEHLHNREEAEDAVQNAFLRIADKPETFFSISGTKRLHYLCAAVKNISLNTVKARKRVVLEEVSEDIVYRNDENLIENTLLEKLSRNEIIAFIDALPEAQRMVLILSYSAKLSADETASALNIPVSKVYKRLCAARKAVKKFIEERNENNV